MALRDADVVYIANGNGLSANQGGSIVRTMEVAKRIQRHGLRVGLSATRGGMAVARQRGFVPDLYVETPVFPLGPRRETGPGSRALNYLWTSGTGGFAASRVRAPVTVTDSDYPCDVVSALTHKAMHGSRWLGPIHHRLEFARDSTLRNLSVVWQRLAWRAMARLADRILVYDSPMGASVADELGRWGAPQERLHRMTNGVDVQAIDAAPAALETWDGLFVGGLRPDKGLEDLPPIWGEVVRHRPGARLAVAGGTSPAYARAFDEACRRLGVEGRVERLGDLPPARVYGLMKSAKCVLAASRTEGWGTATCEALAAGAPVVAYDLPTTRYVFGEAVDLVPAFNHGEFAQRILTHVEGTPSVEAVEQRRAFARRFDWSAVARSDFQVIESLLISPIELAG